MVWTTDASAEAAPARRPGSALRYLRRVRRIAAETRRRIHVKIWLANLLVGPLPPPIGVWIRPQVYRWAGFKIGRRASIYKNIAFDCDDDPYSKLTVGSDFRINEHCYFNLSAQITIGDRVSFADHVILITDSHRVGPPFWRCGERYAAPITIEDGVWICAGCIVQPGVTIGRGSIVGTGAVVAKDVPPHSFAGGVPARVLKALPVDVSAEDRREMAARGLEDVVLEYEQLRRPGQGGGAS